MKTVKEMLADVRADQAHRQQLEQEQQQKKLEYQQAVALAEKELQEALGRQDQEAYHAAEGRLSYAREVLRNFEAVNPWWTPAEGREIVGAAFNAYRIEEKEKYKQVFDLLQQIDVLLEDAYSVSMAGKAIERIIVSKTKTNCGYAFPIMPQRLPQEFANRIAMMAGTSYIPPKRF